jgi:hypothetical protein
MRRDGGEFAKCDHSAGRRSCPALPQAGWDSIGIGGASVMMKGFADNGPHAPHVVDRDDVDVAGRGDEDVARPAASTIVVAF